MLGTLRETLRHQGPLSAGIGAALVLCWLPLPLASVTPTGVFVFRVAAALLVTVTVMLVPSLSRRNPVALPAGTVLSIAGLGLLQAHLGCPGILRQASPMDTGHLVFWTPLSLSPALSREAAITWAAAAALLVAGGWIGFSRTHRRLAFGAILAVSLFQVLYGLPRMGSDTQEIWGIAVAGGSRLRGTFVNPNHLAAYLGMALPVLFAWGWWAIRRAKREDLWERRLALGAPPLVGWLMVLIALAFTGSRGGLAAALAAAAGQVALLVVQRRRWRLAPLAILLPIMAVGVVAMTGLEQGLGRWLATSPHELTWNARTQVYRATVDLWQRSPLFGTGLGTFRDAFPLVQPASLGDSFAHAHSDHLELLATTGLVGVSLLAAGAALLVARLLRILHLSEPSEARAAGLAGLGVVVGLATHALVEFPMTIPAISGTAALVLGLAAGTPVGRTRRGSTNEGFANAAVKR